MKLFVTGISGLLGLNIGMELRSRFQVAGIYHTHPIAVDDIAAEPLDATLPGRLDQLLEDVRPDVIIHTAGLTNVEECEANPDLACRLNVNMSENVARTAARLEIKLVHLSSDHLFDGERPNRSETEMPVPVNVYARTKWRAEQVVAQACPGALIIRTNFFGWGTSIRTSFTDWILRALEDSRSLSMFTNVFFTPILMNDLIDLILQLVRREASGIYHVAGGDRLSKYDFALMVAEVFGCPADQISAASVSSFPFKAKRPRDMSLSCRRTEELLGISMPRVSEGLLRLRSLRERGWQQTLEQAVACGLPSQGPDRHP